MGKQPFLLSTDNSTFAKRSERLVPTPAKRHDVRQDGIGVFAAHNPNDAVAGDQHGGHATKPAELEGVDYSYLPFGAGKHTCLGRRFAVTVVDEMLSALLEKGVDFDGETPALLGKPLAEQTLVQGSAYNFPSAPVYVCFNSMK